MDQESGIRWNQYLFLVVFYFFNFPDISGFYTIESLQQNNMIKILKILTVISFLSIIINGEQIGPIGLFILYSIFQSNIFVSIVAILCLLALITFIYSIIKPIKSEFCVFSIGGSLLMIAIIHCMIFLVNDEASFLFTTLIFIIIFTMTLIKIYKLDLLSRDKIK
jgi:hypothetical protein